MVCVSHYGPPYACETWQFEQDPSPGRSQEPTTSYFYIILSGLQVQQKQDLILLGIQSRKVRLQEASVGKFSVTPLRTATDVGKARHEVGLGVFQSLISLV